MIDEINKVIKEFEKMGYTHKEAVDIVEKACNLSDKELKDFKNFSDGILLDKNWYFLRNLNKCEPPPIKIVYEGEIKVEGDDNNVNVVKKPSKMEAEHLFFDMFGTTDVGILDCSNMSDEEIEEINRIIDKFNSIPEVYPITAEDLQKILERSKNEQNC